MNSLSPRPARMIPLALLLLLACWLNTVSAKSTASFDCPTGVGVKWRYWVEDGNISFNDLSADIAAIAGVGSAGIELVPYQSYGFPTFGVDIGVSGYGSAMYKDYVNSAAALSLQHNLTVDVCAGPSQGAGIPSLNPDVPGFNTELAYGWTVLLNNSGFQGPLPPPLVIPLEKYGGSVAPVFNITTYRLESVILAALAPSANASLPTIILDFTTVLDISRNVSGGILSLSPVLSNSVVVAFYARRNGYQEAYGSAEANASLPASWGAFVVDHFSTEGANAIDNFTAAYLFNPPAAALLNAGKLIWEDSLEFRSQLYWTSGFMETFKKLRNYSASTVLPAFYSRANAPFGGINLPKQVFTFSDEQLNTRVFFDYCDTLTALYMEYISTRNANAAALGLRLSMQAGYGFQVDIAAAQSMVSVPEIETLAFTTVDACRQVSGGIHLAGANILSSEFAAEQVKAYSLTWSEMEQLANVQFAGGVNQLVFHGFPHNGPVPLTTWPGFTPFSFVYSEMHGPRQPAWGQYAGYLSHFTRVQYILQKGTVGKVDIAIYRHGFNVAYSPLFASNILQILGFSYEYISPYNLQLPLAKVVNKRLGDLASAPGYKALVLVNQTTMVATAAVKLLALAKAGLPIVVLGKIPSDIPGYEPGTVGKDIVVQAMAQMLVLPNVRQVNSYDALSAALSALGVRAATTMVGSTTDALYSVRRTEFVSAENSQTDYYWLYNAGSKPVNVSINFETEALKAIPFYLDSWTGDIRCLLATGHPQPGVVQLAGVYMYPQQTLIFAFTNGTQFEGMQVAHALSGAVPVWQYSAAATLAAAAITSESLSSAAIVDGWKLSMTAYNAPSDLNVFSSSLRKFGPINLGDALVYLNFIPQLAGNTSGIAFYSATFSILVDPDSVMAVLDVSAAVGTVSHAVSVWLNGMLIAAAIDPATQLVVLPACSVLKGNNSITLQIATTLLNSLNTVPATSVQTLGGNRLSGLPFVPPNTNNGIQGKIQIRLLPNNAASAPISSAGFPSMLRDSVNFNALMLLLAALFFNVRALG